MYRRRALHDGRVKPASVIEAIELAMPLPIRKRDNKLTKGERKAMNMLTNSQQDHLKGIAEQGDYQLRADTIIEFAEVFDWWSTDDRRKMQADTFSDTNEHFSTMIQQMKEN